jgi:hypothetical protein
MENNKQKTAVEWFNDKILIHLNFDQRLYVKDIFKQAKEMEKEQIKNSFIEGANTIYAIPKTFDEYYNETYGGGEQ